MKYKITDLMDLYEDPKCPFDPSVDQGQKIETQKETIEVKQTKHRFGWKEGLSLAAALGIVVLGGFGVKRLIDRGAAPVVPGASSELAPIESRNSDWEAMEGEEKEAISRFLTVFVNQHIKNVPMEDLNNPGSLIHFAFVWRRNNDCESITVREGPEGLTDTLTLEQINEVLEPLLGKTVELPENDPGIVNRTPGMDFDYSEQLGREAGSVCYRDGCFWDQPAQNDTGLFFALATLRAPGREPGRELVLFNVYYVNYERWGTIDMAAMPALSTAEAEALEAEDKLILTATGSAELERNGDGYRLLSYVTEPTAQRPDEPEPETESLTEPDTTFAPEEDPALLAELKALFSDPGGWYSRALSSIYARPEDVNLYLLFYDGISGDSLTDAELKALYGDNEEDRPGCGTDRLPADQMNEVLIRCFGLGLEETAKNGLSGFAYLPETDCWYHCHGDTNIEDRRITAVRLQADGTVLLTYEAGFWYELTERRTPALRTAALRPVGSGQYQILSNLPGEWVTAEDLGGLSALFRLSGPQRAESRDADGAVTVRELDFLQDGEFRYREGDPDSEFSYWAWGQWWVTDDHSFHCAMCETKEDGNRIGPWYSASFACAIDGDELVLTQMSETGFRDDAPGTELRFAPAAEE